MDGICLHVNKGPSKLANLLVVNSPDSYKQQQKQQ